jgi:hypothetical protein
VLGAVMVLGETINASDQSSIFLTLILQLLLLLLSL